MIAERPDCSAIFGRRESAPIVWQDSAMNIGVRDPAIFGRRESAGRGPSAPFGARRAVSTAKDSVGSRSAQGRAGTV